MQSRCQNHTQRLGTAPFGTLGRTWSLIGNASWSPSPYQKNMRARRQRWFVIGFPQVMCNYACAMESCQAAFRIISRAVLHGFGRTRPVHVGPRYAAESTSTLRTDCCLRRAAYRRRARDCRRLCQPMPSRRDNQTKTPHTSPGLLGKRRGSGVGLQLSCLSL